MSTTHGKDAQEAQKATGSGSWNYAGAHVPKLIEQCERLLEYASNKGIKFDRTIAKEIAQARAAFARGQWTPEHEACLYAAKSALTQAISPVTLHTLCDSTIQEAKKITRFYFRLTLALVILIVPVSMIVFTDSSLSTKGKELIKENDRISLNLHNELQDYLIAIQTQTPQSMASAKAASADARKSDPNMHAISVAHDPQSPTDVPIDPTLKLSVTPHALELKQQLQDFARNNRQLYAETKWLIDLTLHTHDNMYESPWMLSGPTLRRNLELDLPILVQPGSDPATNVAAPKPSEAIDDGMRKLAVYQDIRAMAQNAQRTSDILWGAVTTYLLPVLYAMLGALAFILRELTEQNSNKTFYPAYARLANRMRLLTAVIVGTVIGLFDNVFKSPGGVASASPLAIAFLAGYASDAFFAFLNKSALQQRGKQA